VTVYAIFAKNAVETSVEVVNSCHFAGQQILALNFIWLTVTLKFQALRHVSNRAYRRQIEKQNKMQPQNPKTIDS
jgi:hypothetical protein